MIDVLLINPGDQISVFQGLAFNATAKEPPIWARLIASYLRGRSMTPAILDAEALNLSADSVAHLAKTISPRLIAVVVHGHQPSASTQKMPSAVAVVRALKEALPETHVVLVGGHPAALPFETAEETGVFVCTGEGPVTVYELAWAIKNREMLDTARGFVLANSTGKGIMPMAPNVTDLDGDMPGGCWDLLPMKEYRAYAHHGWTNNNQRQPYASIYTSLNCPFRCSFCMISTPFREGDALVTKGRANVYRVWSAESVIKEIEELVERYGVTNIRVDDEMFVLNERHVLDICDKVTERYGDRLNFWCYGRVDQTKEKFLAKMRAAGFKWLCLGIESMSEHVRDGVEKGSYSEQDVVDTVRRVQAHGINIIANYMFGLPDDTLESMQRTLDLAIELRTEYVNFYAAVAYPGSRLWDEKIAAGWQPPKDWLAWSFHSYEHEPLGTNTLTPAEVLAFRDRAFQRYMRDPGYLALVRKKFGNEVAKSVIATADVKLPRRLLEAKI